MGGTDEGAMRDLACEHVLASQDKQLRMNGAHDGARFWVDLEQGELVFKRGLLFGKKERYRCQILALTGPAGWTWSWADPRVPALLTRAAITVRARGERDGLSTFTTPSLTLSGAEDAISLALVCVGLLRAHFYLLVTTDELGDAWVVVTDPAYAMPPLEPFARFLEMLQLIGQIPLPEHRQPLSSYARWLGLRVEDRPAGILRVASDRDAVDLSFDAFALVAGASVG
ncbi:MAG: hypothetical protein H6719_26245 [Sandaracinaceae bacterium]|nr:hypothetical protein [Sandaracinaceae bacterium]